ncbi:MAG TPA: beta-ketoacyl synthase N-terminal-like domain-containing protein [Azospirillaceae bacterium]|nr:beta-ketoacyl synthase N-terminal-like domain-containing protein [Azospirillaceae bacterium]
MSSTLADALLSPRDDAKGIHFVRSRNDIRPVGYVSLREKALEYLGVLQQAGVRRGDELLLVTDDNEFFVFTFWACLIGGIIPVPVATPGNEETALKILRVTRFLKNPWIACDHPVDDRLAPAADAAGEPEREALARLSGRALTADGVFREPKDAGIPAGVGPDDIAFIQFSSGSTGDPKGVMLTHANLIANVSSIMEHIGEKGRSTGRFVSWMPLTHDLGIIFYHIMPLVFGLDQCLIPTRLFSRHPTIWMQVLSDFRGSFTGGPNYSFRHVLKHMKPRETRDWDLSALRYIMNAAEPISVPLTWEFIEALKPYGFAPGMMAPSYGLAEATLGVSTIPIGEGMTVYGADRRYLTVGTRVKPSDDSADPERVLLAQVGGALPGVEIRIVDDEGLACPDDVVGAIHIRSPGVMKGYYNNLEATRKVLSADGWFDTGDLGFLRVGRLVITGRRKDLVIVNGVNYYPHDIERVAAEAPGLDLNMVAACAVPFEGGDREAVAVFVLFRRSLEDFQPLASAIKDLVARKVGIGVDYCLPVTRIPKTTSGKLQRFHFVERFRAGAFTEAIQRLEDLAGAEREGLREPWLTRDREGLRAALLAEAGRIAPQGVVAADVPLMEAGFTSMRLVELLNRLNAALGLELPVPFVFENPTIDALAAALLAMGESEAPRKTTAAPTDHAIAIVGIGCRLPGGVETPETFWTLLEQGVDTTGAPPAGRWTRADVPSGIPLTTDRGAYLADIETFDPRFFNLTQVEAEAMDPQQRLLLMTAWEALENAAIAPSSLKGSRAGVFIGIGNVDYIQAQQRSGRLSDIGAYAYTGTALCVAAGRLSFLLGLQGPSFALDTACSSALVALHQAVRALRSGECPLAIVGGVNLILSPEGQVCLSHLNALSPEGRCKAFDAGADGYARGEGAITVVLKRLADAQADGDRVWAVIRGSAVNHDGPSNGLTAPNGQAQQAVLRAALDDAGIDPAGVGYVEAHGTGTALGDPIEVSALAKVYGENREAGRPLLIGSVKTNVGHLEAAAGLAGLLKVVLAMNHGRVPPSLHLRTPNPMIPWAETPVRVADRAQPWPMTGDGTASATAVSAFGMSGTNAHVILGPPPGSTRAAAEPDEAVPLVLSARTPPALAVLAERYAARLHHGDPAALHDLARTAAIGRNAFPCRMAVAGADPAELADRLEVLARNGRQPVSSAPKVIFALSGQGSQVAGVGRRLAEREPVFRDSLKRAEAILAPHLPKPLTELLFDTNEAEALEQTAVTQPAVTAFAVALADLLRSWGIEPAGVIGHSIGEIAGAVIAGVLDVESALILAAKRGRLMQGLPAGGAMAAVATESAKVTPLLEATGGRVAIAAVNGPESLTLSGEAGALNGVLETLRGQGVRVTRLKVSHAFHSPLMDPVLEEWASVVAGLALAEPRMAFYSTLLGHRADRGMVATPGYWVRHVREPVRFHEALQSLPEDSNLIVVELGMRPSLMPLAARNLPGIPWLACFDAQGRDDRLMETLGALFEAGAKIDWKAVFAHRPGRPVSAPTYPFLDKTRILPVFTPAAQALAKAPEPEVAPEPVDEVSTLLSQQIDALSSLFAEQLRVLQEVCGKS